MKTSLLFLARNRLEFTRESFTSLRLNTNWERVSQLLVYDDGSEDGTREWLQAEVKSIPTRAAVACSDYGSPTAITNDFLATARADLFAKVDNDTLMPPGWLDVALGIFWRRPVDLDCLGLEYWGLDGPEPHVGDHTDSTGGLYVARRVAFPLEDLPRVTGTYGLLQAYQHRREMRCAWIKPSIKVIPMDRIPASPYAELSRAYIRQGWQRPWKGYALEQHDLWDWWIDQYAEYREGRPYAA